MKEDVHIRIDEYVMRGVRAYATSHGISLAAAVSVLLRRALVEERKTSHDHTIDQEKQPEQPDNPRRSSSFSDFPAGKL